jgi:hypothetical protein
MSVTFGLGPYCYYLQIILDRFPTFEDLLKKFYWSYLGPICTERPSHVNTPNTPTNTLIFFCKIFVKNFLQLLSCLTLTTMWARETFISSILQMRKIREREHHAVTV